MKYVYLVRAGAGNYKVGISDNVLKRVKALQTSNANLVEVVTAKQTPDAADFERQIHESLKEKKLDGGREWFNLTDRQALDLAVLINTSPTIGVSDIDSLRQLLNEHMEQGQQWLDEYERRQKHISGKMEQLIAQISYDKVMPKPERLMAENRKKTTRDIRIAQKADEDNALIEQAIEIVNSEGKASTSLLQRRLSIGYGRASRIIEELETRGVVGPLLGIRREVLPVRLDAA